MCIGSMDNILINLNTQLGGDQLPSRNQMFDFYKNPEELLYDFFWEAYFEKTASKIFDVPQA